MRDPLSDSEFDHVGAVEPGRSIGLRVVGLLGAVVVAFSVLGSWRAAGGVLWYVIAYVGLIVVWTAGSAQQHRDRKAGRTSRDPFLFVLRLAALGGGVFVAWETAREFAL